MPLAFAALTNKCGDVVLHIGPVVAVLFHTGQGTCNPEVSDELVMKLVNNIVLLLRRRLLASVV
jgi:hypothetical protein